jgi:predicted nucleic acid-binding protein
LIVADTSLIAYLLLPGPQTPHARAVFQKDPLWAAPLLWRSEFRNVLGQAMRLQGMMLSDALRFMQDAERLLEKQEFAVASAPVLNLAQWSSCAAYDCEFVHLAQELGVPLVTSDQKVKVLRAFPGTAVSLEDFVK